MIDSIYREAIRNEYGNIQIGIDNSLADGTPDTTLPCERLFEIQTGIDFNRRTYMTQRKFFGQEALVLNIVAINRILKALRRRKAKFPKL